MAENYKQLLARQKAFIFEIVSWKLFVIPACQQAGVVCVLEFYNE